jgi:glycogen debranching enzyme
VGAAMRTGHHHLGHKLLEMVLQKLPKDHWPEYYDGKAGTLIGRRANFNQTWSAAATIVAYRFLQDEDSEKVYQSITF